MEPSYGRGARVAVPGVDAVRLPTLTIRQLIGLLADTEDRVRALRSPSRAARGDRLGVRQVLREQGRVLDELHRRHPCPV